MQLRSNWPLATGLTAAAVSAALAVALVAAFAEARFLLLLATTVACLAVLALCLPGLQSSLRQRIKWTVLVAVVLTLPMLRWSGPGNTAAPDLAILAIVCVAAAGLPNDSRLRAPQPLVFWLALYLVAGAIALVVALDRGRAMLTVAQDLYLFAFWLACYQLLFERRDPIRLPLLARVWCAVAALHGAIILIGPYSSGLLQRLLTFGGWGWRGIGLFKDPNMAGHYLGMSLLVLPLALMGLERAPARVLTASLAAPMILGLVATGSNGAKVALIAALIVGVAFWLVRSLGSVGLRGAALSIFGVLALSGLILLSGRLLGPEAAPRLRSSRAETTRILRLDSFPRTWSSRVSTWSAAYESFRAHPLGVGPGVLGRDPGRRLPGTKEAHSDALAALGERGLLGLIGYLGLVFAWGRQLARQARQGLSTWLLGSIAASVFLFVAGLSIDSLHFRHLWFLAPLIVPPPNPPPEDPPPPDLDPWPG